MGEGSSADDEVARAGLSMAVLYVLYKDRGALGSAKHSL